MRNLLLLILFLLPMMAFSQKKINLKRRFLGTYEGEIPAYVYESGSEMMNVAAETIVIEIGKNQVSIKIGDNVLYGTFTIMFEAKTYYLLDVRIEGQLANERIMVYKTGKRLSRDGMYPQPVTELKKLRKR